MLDNSVGMADKHELLKPALNVLLAKLISPACVDGSGVATGVTVDASGACPTGSKPEFPPVTDIHVGIVSSSLGSHGGSVCSAADPTDPSVEYLDDHGHLIGSARPGLTSWNNSGFLAWDPTQKANTPPGDASLTDLSTQLGSMVDATGEHGCGYEASLESWYRFLVDPEPPQTVTKAGNTTVRQGMDQTLLAQRKAFLRPDSLVAIVMLTDENDCSIEDEGIGWFVGATSHMPKATAVCATNPNDPCCRSCAQNETSPPAGCTSLAQDEVCMGAPTNSYNTWDSLNDSLNLRCFDQKQRFGFDLLYPTSRYVKALTSAQLTLESDNTTVVANPLFDPGQSGLAPRDPSAVFLAGIVGVPWQDLATADSLTSPTSLTYLDATELVAQGRWSQLLGNATASPPVPPSDPFMIESELPRSGFNPNVAVNIAAATSTNPHESAINGHEHVNPTLDDLQYACTFALATSKPCAPGDPACPCSATLSDDASALIADNSPICQPPGGGPAGTTQYFAKAYPGARELTVLRDFGENSIVASICPKETVSTNAATDPNYGYNPAMLAIIDRLREALVPRCLPRALDKTPDTDQTLCSVIESQAAGLCDCTAAGRSDVPADLVPELYRQLENAGLCGNVGLPACDATGFCACQINQESGQDLEACLNGASVAEPGFCYVDDPNSSVVAACPANERQLLRFIDGTTAKTPAAGATTFVFCPVGDAP